MLKQSARRCLLAATFLCVAMVAPAQASGSPEPSTVPAEVWTRLTSGANLSHWYKSWRPGESQVSLAQLDRFTSRQEVLLWRQMGLRHVRIHLHQDSLCNSRGEFIPERLRRLHTHIGWFRSAGIVVKICYVADADAAPLLRDRPEHVMALRRFWNRLGRELARYPTTDVVLEVYSEPNFGDAQKWWDVQRVLIREIRQVAPKHTLVLTADRYSAAEDFLHRTPYADRNVVYAFHFYDPFVFTHQGAGWVLPELGGFRNVPYPLANADWDRLERQARGDQGRRVLQGLRAKGGDRAGMAATMQRLRQWATRHNVRVVCNEFGVTRQGVDPAARVRWYRDARAEIERAGFGWTMFEWVGGMGIFYGDVRKADVQANADFGVLEALGFRRPPAPSIRN